MDFLFLLLKLRAFLNNFINDISILEYGKVNLESYDGIEYKFVRIPKMQMRNGIDIEFAVFDSSKPFHARFSAFESDICVITPAGWCPQILAVSNLLGNRLARLITDVKGSTYWKMWSQSHLRNRLCNSSENVGRESPCHSHNLILI